MLSKKSEKLTYAVLLIGAFFNALTGPMLIAVLIPSVPQCAMPINQALTYAISYGVQKGFADSFAHENFFSRCLEFVRKNTFEVMVGDFIFVLANIGILYLDPTIGFVTMPLTTISGTFIEQVAKMDINTIFTNYNDNGKFKTYYDSRKAQHGTEGQVLGSIVSILITMIFTIEVWQVVALILAQNLIVIPLVMARRLSLHEDAIKITANK